MGCVALALGDALSAGSHHRESLRLRSELGDRMGVADSLGGLAQVAWQLGHHERAARLFGAAEALRERVGAPLTPGGRADYDRRVAATTAALGSAAFNAAWAKGLAMTLEEAIAYALEEGRPEATAAD